MDAKLKLNNEVTGKIIKGVGKERELLEMVSVKDSLNKTLNAKDVNGVSVVDKFIQSYFSQFTAFGGERTPTSKDLLAVHKIVDGEKSEHITKKVEVKVNATDEALARLRVDSND